jgi:hypothetical protein
VDTRSLAYPAHPSTEEHPCACYEGVDFVGHLGKEDGQETEIVEAVACNRCKSNRYVG